MINSRRRRAASPTRRRKDQGSLFVLVTLLVVGIFLAFSWSELPGATITWHRPVVFAVGVALMLVGVALRWWAVRSLGRFFTTDVAVVPQQQVIQRGPYRFIRHPSYSGTLLTMLGLGLAMTSWASLVANMFCTLAGLAYRVRVEEQALSAELGRPYVEYMRRTRRFIPFMF
jgi:protein-S-isoprenylcysteine O-methyltransferase Ste14